MQRREPQKETRLIGLVAPVRICRAALSKQPSEESWTAAAGTTLAAIADVRYEVRS